MTIILGCGAATIQGWLLHKPWLLTSPIQYTGITSDESLDNIHWLRVTS